MLGHSGSGRSTLLRILAGLDSQADGIGAGPPLRAVVFQNPRLLPWRRALANVTFALPDPGPDAPSRIPLAGGPHSTRWA